ncbi:MAG TPA: C-type lectin domain-containing protein [Polyangiaceae bacterium]
MTGTAAAAAAILGACAGGTLLEAIACIPDLPSAAPPAAEASVDAPGAEAEVEAAPPPAPPRCGDGIIQLDDEEQCDPGGNLPADAAADVTSAGCNSKCQFVCPGFLWPRNNHCYTVDTRQATALDDQASVYCGNSGGHVVTFASEDEVSAVVTALEAGAFWVGLDPDPVGGANQYTSLALYEPGWAPTCPGCFAHTADAAAPLPGAAQGCVEAPAELDASWQQYPCNDAGKLHVVCEREPTGVLSEHCEGGICIDLVWTHALKRYVYVTTKLDGADAVQQCAALGGTLVVLQSRDEREQLWHELSHSGTTPGSIWIGLSRPGTEWIWDDDASADAYPSPWGNDQPSGNASRAYLLQSLMPPAPFDTTLGRNDENVVSTKLYSVCEVPATPSAF